MLVCVGMMVCVCCYYIRKIGLCSLRGLSFIAGTKREDPSVTKKLFSSSQKCYYELPLAFMYTVQALLWLERMFVLTRFNQKFFAWICRVSSSLVVLFSDIKKGFNIRKEIDETTKDSKRFMIIFLPKCIFVESGQKNRTLNEQMITVPAVKNDPHS